ncbi:hypothetical protein GCM10022204_33620 [Microlunatus aurantiacus]|uniref:Uncharacterized protein n=1 Tax=Microlunatus aurantiacus TaxID=446786 RepID=A0ABP7E4G6_9ACTN
MPRLTTITGALLVLTGVVAFIVTSASSVTALIPAFVGGLLLICAALAGREALRRHAIHAALVVALLGALGSLMNVAKIGQLFAGTAERPAAIIVSVILFVVCVVYVAIGVRSFIAARRTRAAA